MQRVILACLVLLIGFAAPARATVIGCHAPPAGSPDGTPAVGMDQNAVAGWLRAAAPAMRIGGIRQTTQAVPTLDVTLRGQNAVDQAAWRGTWFEAFAFPATRSPSAVEGGEIIIGLVRPPIPSDEQERTLQVEFSGLERGWIPSRWQVVVLACVQQPGPPLVRTPRAYARDEIRVSSLALSTVIGLGAAGGLYLLIGLAAAGVHARQLAFIRAARDREGRATSWLGFALRPTVVMQDAFGTCSLARFQVLLFTLVLTGVYAYAMARSGEMPGLSTTVLTLLGITLTGSTLARAASTPIVDTPNRLWLLGTGVIDPRPRLPAWRDLLAGDGEVDVTRVQAVAFSLFAAAALVLNGTSDLSTFEIPNEINYLMGLSQFVYVAGKALPQEAAKRLNEEVRALRDAEQKALDKPGDETALRTFETARNAVASVLFDVFGERFDEQTLRTLRPGYREVPRTAPV